MMIDTYVASESREALEAFCGAFVNTISVQRGRAAVPESVDAESGVVFPGSEAAGDVGVWYACIRAPVSIPVCEGIVVVPDAVGKAVVGGWVLGAS